MDGTPRRAAEGTSGVCSFGFGSSLCVWHHSGNILNHSRNLLHLSGNIWHNSRNIWHHSGNSWKNPGNVWYNSGNIWHNSESFVIVQSLTCTSAKTSAVSDSGAVSRRCWMNRDPCWSMLKETCMADKTYNISQQ